MFIKQKDILGEMSNDFVKKIMDISIKESFEKGAFLFHENDYAGFFYVLLKGRVKLSIIHAGHMVYTINHAGELFGWSSLIGRETYTASAECVEPTTLLKFDRDLILNVLEKDPVNGVVFFKGLAWSLGNRLIQSYKNISASYQATVPLTGTGQIQEDLIEE